jgi:hypothetical protein
MMWLKGGGMKHCKNCGHEIRKIKGVWKHRMEHPKYSGIGGSGGVTFNLTCLNRDYGLIFCRCKAPSPIPAGKGRICQP